MKLLEKKWDEIQKLMPKNTNAEKIKNIQKMFYMGANAVIMSIVENSDADDNTSVVGALSMVGTEILIYKLEELASSNKPVSDTQPSTQDAKDIGTDIH